MECDQRGYLDFLLRPDIIPWDEILQGKSNEHPKRVYYVHRFEFRFRCCIGCRTYDHNPSKQFNCKARCNGNLICCRHSTLRNSFIPMAIFFEQ